MAENTFMLVCNAGMSTSLLVSKMQKVASEKGVDAEIFAVSANEVDNKIKNQPINAILLGPQVRFMKKQMEDKVADKNIPVGVINMQDYGMVNGENVLNTALELSEE